MFNLNFKQIILFIKIYFVNKFPLFFNPENQGSNLDRLGDSCYMQFETAMFYNTTQKES